MSAIVLWRHAPTPDNEAGKLQGRRDGHLDAAGRERARWAAERIVALGGREMRIVSGPLARARETAQVLADLVGAPVTIDDAFNQRSYGAWEGLTWDEARQQWPEAYAQWERGVDPHIPGWEGQAAVAVRVGEALERIWDDEVPAVVVSHGSPITLGMLHLIGQPASSRALGRVPHAACAVLRRVPSGAMHIDAFGLGGD